MNAANLALFAALPLLAAGLTVVVRHPLLDRICLR